MKIRIKIKYFTVIMCFICFITLLSTQEVNAQKITLRVGDQAPKIKGIKWIKGKPITELEKGKVHVVEFSSTW